MKNIGKKHLYFNLFILLVISVAFYASTISVEASESVTEAVYGLTSQGAQNNTNSIPGYYDDTITIRFNDTEATKNYTYFYFENPNQCLTFAYQNYMYMPYNMEFNIYQNNQHIGSYFAYYDSMEEYYDVNLREGLNKFHIEDDTGSYSIYINVVYIPSNSNAQRKGEIMQAVINANNQSVDEASFLAAESMVNAQLAIPYDNFDDKISIAGVPTPVSMDKYYNLLYTDQDSVQLNVEASVSAKIYIDGVLSQSLGRSKATIPLAMNKDSTKIDVLYETTGKAYHFCIEKLPPGLDSGVYQDINMKMNEANSQCVDQASYDKSIADIEAYLKQVIGVLKIIKLTGLTGNPDFSLPYQTYVTEQSSLKVSAFSQEPATIIFEGNEIGATNSMWKEANLYLGNGGNRLEIRFGNVIHKIYIFALLDTVKPEIRTALLSEAAEQNGSLTDEAAYQEAVDRLTLIYNCNQDGRVKKLAAGMNHYLALLEDGSVVAWDRNGNPMSVPAAVNKIKDIGAGYDFSVALKADGTVVAWGSNNPGRVLNVPQGLNNVRAISVGWYFCLALKNDGTVVQWGGASVPVPQGLSNVKAVSAGRFHALALKEDGTVVGWGYNDEGEISIPAGLTNVKAISAGDYLSLLLKADGTVVIVNRNYQSYYPAQLTGVKEIFCGDNDTNYAIMNNGSVKVFSQSALYYQDAIQNVPGNGKKAVQVVAYRSYYERPLVLMDDGTVYSPHNEFQPILTGFIKKYTAIGPKIISKSNSILYFENPNQILNVISGGDCQVNFNGQTLKSFTNASEVLSLVLQPGKNNLEISFPDAISNNTRKITMFYLPPEANAAFRQAVLSQVAAADAASVDDNSYNNGINSIMNIKILSIPELGYAMNKPYMIKLSTTGQASLNYDTLAGSLAVSVNGILTAATDALHGSIPFSLKSGQNEIIVQHTNGGTQTYKMCLFYLPPDANAAFRQAVLNQIAAADAASTDDNSYNNGINSIMNMNVFGFPELGHTINKSYSIKLSTKSQASLSYDMFAGSLAVSVNGTPVMTGGTFNGNVSLPLNPGQNEIILQYTNGGIQSYKICLFHLPSESNTMLQQTLGAAIAAADGRMVDEASYQKEVAGIVTAKDLRINNEVIDLNRSFNILYTENNMLSMGVTAYGAVKVLQDFVEFKSFSRDYQNLTLTLHNGVNNLEVQFGEGTAQAVYKICIFYIPANAEPGFRTYISTAVAAARQKSFDQNSYSLEIKGIIQNSKQLTFSNFIGNLDLSRKYRVLYTELSQLNIQCSTAERADISMVKMSNASGVSGSESYVVGGTTGNYTIPLVEGRNLLQVSYTEFGEVHTYFYAIFRGSSQFGNKTKNNIINEVIKADNALVNNDGLTYNIKLADVTNSYFWNLEKNWFKWL